MPTVSQDHASFLLASARSASSVTEGMSCDRCVAAIERLNGHLPVCTGTAMQCDSSQIVVDQICSLVATDCPVLSLSTAVVFLRVMLICYHYWLVRHRWCRSAHFLTHSVHSALSVCHTCISPQQGGSRCRRTRRPPFPYCLKYTKFDQSWFSGELPVLKL